MVDLSTLSFSYKNNKLLIIVSTEKPQVNYCSVLHHKSNRQSHNPLNSADRSSGCALSKGTSEDISGNSPREK